MELRYLLQVIRGNRRLLAGAAILAGLLALAATYVLPETFEASTTVLIRPRKGPAGDQTSKSMMDYPVSFNIPVDTMSKTYAQIMDSDAVASRVVDILHLDTAKPPRDPRWWKRAVQVSRDRAKLVMVRGWEFLRYRAARTQGSIPGSGRQRCSRSAREPDSGYVSVFVDSERAGRAALRAHCEHGRQRVHGLYASDAD